VLSNMVSDLVRRSAPVVDRDREAEFPHIHFLSFTYISRISELFHCVWSARFSHEHFSFHSKMFLFAQDMTITFRSGGIKLEYTFFKFLQSSIFCFILVFIYLFLGCYSFRFGYSLCLDPCAISENQKQIEKCASFG
jgi:hypothetical protein